MKAGEVGIKQWFKFVDCPDQCLLWSIEPNGGRVLYMDHHGRTQWCSQDLSVRVDVTQYWIRETKPFQRGATSADTCRLNGWKVGTVLEGDEGDGPERIKITAVGDCCILAYLIDQRGKPIATECEWDLDFRDWQRV